MHLTLRRLRVLLDLASAPGANSEDKARLFRACEQRRRERGPNKLRRRLTRKVALGRSGAF